MNGINVTQDLYDNDDPLVLIVVKPNLVTPNKPSTNNVSPPSNREPKYINNWTSFNQTFNTVFPYHGDSSFAAAAYGNDPDVDLLRHSPYTRICVGLSNAREVTLVCTLRIDSTKTYVDANPILRKLVSTIFNVTFKSFYDFVMRVNSISPELIEVTDTVYGDISHNVEFYARSKVESDVIYDHCNNFIVHRSEIPNICVETTRDGGTLNDVMIGVGNEQSKITNSLVLASAFNSVLQNELNDSFSKTGAGVSVNIAADVVTQPMLRHNFITEIDEAAKVNESHDTVSLVPMEPSDEFVSDDEFDDVGTDIIVIIKAKDRSASKIITDLGIQSKDKRP